MRRILVAGPYVGELGHEIGNFMPHVAWQLERGDIDRAVVFCRHDRAALYPFATVQDFRFRFDEYANSNWLINPSPAAIAHYEAFENLADMRARLCEIQGASVFRLRMNRTAWRRDFADARVPVRLEPKPELLVKWHQVLGHAQPICVLPIRRLRRGSMKNTDLDFHRRLIDAVAAMGLLPVTVGKTDEPPTPKLGDYDLINQTTIADLIAIYSLAACVAGASTGTMHLAAATCTPHVVWGGRGGAGGGADVRARYLARWNLTNTPCEFITIDWHVDIKDVLEAIASATARAGLAGATIAEAAQ